VLVNGFVRRRCKEQSSSFSISHTPSVGAMALKVNEAWLNEEFK